MSDDALFLDVAREMCLIFALGRATFRSGCGGMQNGSQRGGGVPQDQQGGGR